MTTPIDIRMHVVAHVPEGWDYDTPVKYVERCRALERYIRGKDRTMDEPVVALYESMQKEWEYCCEELDRNDFPSEQVRDIFRGKRDAIASLIRSIKGILDQDRKLS